MSKRTLALLAAFAAATIYGLNHGIAKGAMPDYIHAYGFILLRVIGATALFWIASCFIKPQRIDRKDWVRFVLSALTGMGVNMLSFFKGLELSTPINSAVLITTTPIIVVLLSIILIKEKIWWIRGSGIIVGLIGALVLILYGKATGEKAPNIPAGNLLFLGNALFFGLYLVLVKPLTEKYHPCHLMKWLFLLGIFINLPIGFHEFTEVPWANLPFDAVWRMGFVVLGTTFCTYLFNIYALKHLKASTVSSFVYLQPVVTILYAVLIGIDTLSWVKVLACLLVFLGVYLVSRPPHTKFLKRKH